MRQLITLLIDNEHGQWEVEAFNKDGESGGSYDSYILSSAVEQALESIGIKED